MCVWLPRHKVPVDGPSYMSLRGEEVKMSALKENEVHALLLQANAAAARVLMISEDLEFAREYDEQPRPQPSWWMRFSRMKRQQDARWQFAEDVRRYAPRELNIAENDLQQVRKTLKERHRLEYTYKVTPAGFHSWLTELRSGKVLD